MFRQIGANVVYYRSLRGMKQKELAERVSVNPDTLGKIERGCYNKNIPVVMLARIAEGLGIDLYKLFVFEKDIR